MRLTRGKAVMRYGPGDLEETIFPQVGILNFKTIIFIFQISNLEPTGHVVLVLVEA